MNEREVGNDRAESGPKNEVAAIMTARVIFLSAGHD